MEPFYTIISFIISEKKVRLIKTRLSKNKEGNLVEDRVECDTELSNTIKRNIIGSIINVQSMFLFIPIE